jgi:hypothetical protein
MKKIVFYILAATITTNLFLGCEKEDPIGPNLVDLYGPFRILDSLTYTNSGAINFKTDSVLQFSGSWTNMAEWKIEIKGRTSGAVKTITGKSKNLDSIAGQWNGSADGIFFRKEVCDVVFSFKDYPDTMKTTVTIAEPRDYSKVGYIIKHFEGSGAEEFWGGNGKQAKRINKSDAPEGINYFYMEGTEGGSSYWIGSFPPVSAQSIVGKPYFPLNDADTATTYINFFVRGYGTANTFINFQILEDDNGDGVYTEASEDSFSYRYQVPTTATTWQKVSIPLSKLQTEANAAGNSKMEISKITSMFVMLFSNGIATPKLACDIDFVIITKGKPL